jgi:hypothetical protein
MPPKIDLLKNEKKSFNKKKCHLNFCLFYHAWPCFAMFDVIFFGPFTLGYVKSK